MDFQAKVIQCLPDVTGTKRDGSPWRKKEWVVETFGQYPRKVKIQCFGDRAESMVLEPGKDYTLSVDLESREFNGKWYTDVNVFRYQELQNGGQSSSFGNQPQGGYGNNFGQQPQGGVAEGMPFGGSPASFGPTDEDNGEDLPF